MQQTSLEAYTSLASSGKLNANETLVYDVFKTRPWGYTNYQIAEILHWSINRVTGRTNSLVKKGKLTKADVVRNIQTGKNNIVWALPELIRKI